MKKILIIIFAIVGILILYRCILGCCIVYSLGKQLEIKIDPALYTKIVEKRKSHNNRYNFLPPEIPSDATKVAFFHIPGFLQGADVVILRLALPSERIESIIKELKNNGRPEILISDRDTIAQFHTYPAYGMKKPTSKNRFEGVSELPKDFRVFLLDSDMEDIKTNWNHNVLSFTAVSTNVNEVVYYVDIW